MNSIPFFVVFHSYHSIYFKFHKFHICLPVTPDTDIDIRGLGKIASTKKTIPHLISRPISSPPKLHSFLLILNPGRISGIRISFFVPVSVAHTWVTWLSSYPVSLLSLSINVESWFSLSLSLKMSRFLSKTLIPHGRFFLRRFNEPSLVCFSRRPYSSKPHVIEIDLDSSSSATSKAEAEAAILKKLNEFVRRIVVQNSTPDWLPFAPGSSFWVPPHQSTAAKIANLVDRVTNPLTEEEAFSLFSLSGSPRSSFFIPLGNGFHLVSGFVCKNCSFERCLLKCGFLFDHCGRKQ